MKIRKSLLFHLLVLFPFTYSAQTNSLQQIKVDVVYLSSDYLEGRKSGTKGGELAAEYIAHRFQQIGLDSKGDNKSWYQTFSFKEKVNPHEEVGSGPELTTKNVVGYIDNKAKKTVVIGAHYDHLGLGGHGSLHANEQAIHNGADDNASGIAALIQLAQRLKESKATNNNYLFIAFSAEELGLFGSKSYVNNPTIDLSEMNYMLNMDMVGRLNNHSLLAINGVGTSPSWSILESIKTPGISGIKTSKSGIGPSDHTSFYLKNIPVLHFFTGQHKDYHKPSDDAHLVDYEGIESIANYIMALIEKLDKEGALTFTKTKQDQERKAASFKVTLGVMPDYMYNGEGMRIDAVIDGRTAHTAGMLDGDVVIKIGDVEVKEIYSYMEALSSFEKGDTTIVKVKRAEKIIEKQVTF